MATATTVKRAMSAREIGHYADPVVAEYDDSYATCASTYATLRVFSDTSSPEEVSEALGVAPTRSHLKGEEFGPGSRRSANGWFLESSHAVDSRDLRRHIDWLLDQVSAAGDAWPDLVAGGARADIFCYWESRSGHGGPQLSPSQMERLSEFGLSVGLDIYFPR